MHGVIQLFIQYEFWTLLDIRDSVYLYQTLVQFWMADFTAKGKQLELKAEISSLSKPFIYMEVAAKSFLHEWKALKE